MKLAILLLAAALGSASPARTPNSIQGRDGQNACNCCEGFRPIGFFPHGCPAGYEKASSNHLSDCVQINCSADDYKAQCSAKPTGCNCCEGFRPIGFFPHGCPAGYEKASSNHLSDCVQTNCSADDYKAQCSAKPQDAAPTAVVEKPKPQEPSKATPTIEQIKKAAAEACNEWSLNEGQCTRAQAQCVWACTLRDKVHEDCPREDKQAEPTLDDISKCIRNMAV